MHYSIEKVKECANYMVENHCTIREVAKEFHYSKSSVHQFFRERLPYIDMNLYLQVFLILEENKKQRAIRGGISTKNKYLNSKKNKTSSD